MADKKFAEDCLKAINEHRAKHQVEPLTLNPEISEVSQKWVDHLASTNSFGHNPNRTFKGGNMGENCAMNYRSDGAEFTGRCLVIFINILYIQNRQN